LSTWLRNFASAVEWIRLILFDLFSFLYFHFHFLIQTLKQNTQVKSPSQDSASSKGGDESLSPSQNGPSTENVRPAAKKESVSTQTPSRSALVFLDIFFHF
jgi:hypothetical protein